MSDREIQEGYVVRVTSWLRALPRRKAILLSCAVVSLIPLPTAAVPEWKVRVAEAGGAPVAGATVRLWWHDYTLGSDDYAERRTGADGYAVLPEQRVWASLLRRITLPILEAILRPINIHGSSGLHAYAMAVADGGRSELVILDRNGALPAEIIMRR